VPAQQPGLTLDCAAGKIDLNHASVATLQGLPGVSKPIAQRIVDSRPHDRTKDLLVVPGIGPGKLTEIEASGRACSTPLTLPPPAADACASPGQLDVNNPASRDRLAAIFGAPTAQRIVDAQPFPDLAHAKTVLVAGAGSGKVAKAASGLCATPVPKTTGGVNYSYVYARSGGRADLGKFTLVVPAGVLTAGIGQWLRISPQPTPTPDMDGPAWPSAQFSILGAQWADGSKHVYVTMPTDPELTEFGDSAIPVISHYDGDTRSTGEIATTQVSPSTGTITAAVTHLSLLDAISQGVSWVAEPLGGLLLDARFPAPDCDGSWTLDSNTGSWTHGTAHVDLTGALLNLPGNIVPPFGWPQKHCVQSASSNPYDAHVSLVNNTRTFESLTRYSGDPKLGDASLVGADPLELIITGLAESVLGHPVAYPGAQVSVEVPSGQQAAVRMTPNIPITAFWAVVNETPIADLLDDIGNDSPETNAVIKDGLGCALSELNGAANLDASTNNALDALAGMLKDCIDFESIKVAILDAEHSGKIAPDKVGRIGVTLNKLQRYVLWLKVGRVAITGYDSWLGYAGGSAAGIIDVENYAPKPDTDSLGRRVHDACLVARGYGWSIDMNCQNAYYAGKSVPANSGSSTTPDGLPGGKILRNSLGNAWFANYSAGTVAPISDGGTYLCLAKHYPVDWDARLGDYTDPANPGHYTFDSTPVGCDSSLSDDRPINSGQTDNTTIILRQSDGTAWVIWSAKREHIESGAEFECWVNPAYAANIEFDVWDQVTDTQLSNWPIDTTTHVSNCGDPTNPGF
jgi:hypothetical protein